MPLAPIAPHDLRVGDRVLPTSSRCLVMGIVNVTPDSFADGGRSMIERGTGWLPSRPWCGSADVAGLHQLGAYRFDGIWFDIGRQEDYERASAAWAKGHGKANGHAASEVEAGEETQA